MNPFNAEGLWLKSRLFINRALDPNRGFEEQAFWACASLELLGKSALARLSPLLVATPTDDGKSLLVASGSQDSSDATSIQAKAVWARAGRVFKPFSEVEAKKLSVGRNEYIHSATVGFDAIPEHAWWPSFWAQAAVLLEHVDREMLDYVGAESLASIESHLATQKTTLTRKLEARLEQARSLLARHEAGTLTVALSAKWSAFKLPFETYTSAAECPACLGSAILGGSNKNLVNVEDHFDEETGEGEVWVTLEIDTNFLACPRCHLVIDDYALLNEAQVDTAFDAVGDIYDVDYVDYNNE
ncbi:hypothetical protein ACMT9Y_10570 [Clavibacter tessellarius]|uniref:hypothetical protein n=1 Tax=Clavibacter tessellarius TaxID=31965 RepID=UPI0039ED74F3